jgi:hypothetical protein
LPAELERAIAALPDDQDRPDLLTAHELLARSAALALDLRKAVAS